VIIRSPDRAEDERIRIGGFQFLGPGSGIRYGCELEAESSKRKQEQQGRSGPA
jgi:hypothetical protein